MWLLWKSSDNILKIWNSFDVLHSQKVNTFVIFCQSLWLIHTSQPILMCSYCVLRATIYYYILDILCGKQLYFDILIFWKSEFNSCVLDLMECTYLGPIYIGEWSEMLWKTHIDLCLECTRREFFCLKATCLSIFEMQYVGTVVAVGFALKTIGIWLFFRHNEWVLTRSHSIDKWEFRLPT